MSDLEYRKKYIFQLFILMLFTKLYLQAPPFNFFIHKFESLYFEIYNLSHGKIEALISQTSCIDSIRIITPPIHTYQTSQVSKIAPRRAELSHSTPPETAINCWYICIQNSFCSPLSDVFALPRAVIFHTVVISAVRLRACGLSQT